MKHAKLM